MEENGREIGAKERGKIKGMLKEENLPIVSRIVNVQIQYTQISKKLNFNGRH